MISNKTKHNAIVGVIDSELLILEYTFYDGETFKGAVGYTMDTMTQDYINERKDLDNTGNELWKQAVENESTILGLEDWWKNMCDEAEINDEYFPLDDPYYRYETNKLYEDLPETDRKKIENILGVKGIDYVDFNCTGSGRCFYANDKWDLILRPDLVELINKLEG